MKVEDIRKLPGEFDFKSNINPFGILYHAQETEHGYKVTCDANNCCWDFSKQEMRKRLFDNEFVIIKE